MSSLFFEFKCQGANKGAPSASAWCRSGGYLFALASSDGEINFYLDEVNHLPAIPAHTAAVTQGNSKCPGLDHSQLIDAHMVHIA